MAALVDGRSYMSRMTREYGISLALLQIHLKNLEASELVTGSSRMSEGGNAVNYYDVVPFSVHPIPKAVE